MFQLLIVDDEIESLEWLKETFERELGDDVEINIANSGRTAIDILNCIKCDVVLTDIRMPGMDGLVLYQHVKENWPDAKVVFLTGYSDHEILYKLSAERDVYYLVKTESSKKIVETVMKAYQKKKEEFDKKIQQELKDSLIIKAKYWLQKELIEQLVFQKDVVINQEKLDTVGLQLIFDENIIMFLGKFYLQNETLTRERIIAVSQVIINSLSHIVNVSVTVMDDYIVGLAQPANLKKEVDWTRILHVCTNALEASIDVIESMLGGRLSIAVYKNKVLMKDISMIFNLLKDRVEILSKEELGVYVLDEKENLSLEDGINKDTTINKMKKYIREHLHEDLSLQLLADISGFNASYLSRIFKKKYHCNLSDFILKERMEKAKDLLLLSDEKIYRIGECVGYYTTSSFNRAFQKYQGVSPAEFRRESRNR